MIGLRKKFHNVDERDSNGKPDDPVIEMIVRGKSSAEIRLGRFVKLMHIYWFRLGYALCRVTSVEKNQADDVKKFGTHLVELCCGGRGT